MSLKLYFDDVFLGNISNVELDDFWQIGDLSPTDEVAKYQYVFDYLTDESETLKPPEDFEEVIFGEHWFIENESGERRRIEAPSVYRDNEIRWQWSEWR